MTPVGIPEGLNGRVLSSLNRLLYQDFELLKLDAHEQALSSKLASYLQQDFPSHHVDCEYNKHSKGLKFTGSDKKEKESRPDIVVHDRGNDQRNLLVIEIKKFGSSNLANKKAIKKLREFTHTHMPDYHHYGYEYGLFLCFDVTTGLTLEWYSNGVRVGDSISYRARQDENNIRNYFLVE